MATTAQDICPDCGNAIPSAAFGGLCPFCLAATVADELDGRTPVPKGDRSAPGRADRIGPYRICERLGEGGYGVVYRAEQAPPLQRSVAIKVMKPGVVSDQTVARFEAERQALAMMDHPAIARVYDVGETSEGLPFFVMELIDGEPITSYCERRMLPREARLEIFAEACRAIGHAHRRGIIHRDLKPSNLLVAEEGGVPQPKVIDFGIAKATESLLTERTLVTRDHQLVGTPAYMSPEQAEMGSSEVDTRSDIYSLGVVLYEILTGSVPFDAAQLAGMPYDEALRLVRTADPQRPSARLRASGRGGGGEGPALIPTDLDWIVMRALEKDPRRRYETADAFARDIERFLRGEAIEARPPTPGYVFGKWVRRYKIPALAVSAVLAAMVAGTIVSLKLYFRAEANAAAAEANAEAAVSSDRRGRRLFSGADFNLASPLIDDGRSGLAIAHLARAIRSNPQNHAASARLLYTLAAEHWARPEFAAPFEFGPVAFSSDGKHLIGIDRRRRALRERPALKVVDADSGETQREVEIPHFATGLAISPDSQFVAVGFHGGGVLLWDLPSLELRREFPPEGDGKETVVEFTGGGHLLAVSRTDGHARLWEPATGRQIAELPGVEGAGDAGYGHFDLSADGAVLVVGHRTQLRVYGFPDGRQIGEAIEVPDVVQGVACAPDGARFVSWGSDSTARVWDARTGELSLTLRHEKPVRRAAISPDGSRLATGTGSPRGREPSFSRLWDLGSGRLLGDPVAYPSEVECVAFSPDGAVLAVGSLVHRLGDGALRLLDGLDGRDLNAPIAHPRGATKIAFSPDGGRIAVSSRHEATHVWDLRRGIFAPIRVETGAPVWRAVFGDGDDASFLTVGEGGIARRWSAADGAPISAGAADGSDFVEALSARGRDSLANGIRGRPASGTEDIAALLKEPHRGGRPIAAAASSDGELLLTGCRDGRLRRWATRDGSAAGAALIHGGVPVTAVAISPDAGVAASGGADGSVVVWDLARGAKVYAERLHKGPVFVLAFSADGSLLGTGSADDTARIVWLDPAAPRASPPLDNAGRVNHVAFSPDGGLLASAGVDNAARLWSVGRGGAPAAPPLRHIDTASFGLFLLWTPDSRSLVTTGSHDDTSRIWDAATGKMLAKPMELPTAALSAALRPDGEALLTGDDYDFHARVWDLASGEPMTPLLKHDERVLTSAFDSTGGRVLTGTRAGSAYLWDVPAPVEPLPEWFLSYAESIGGFRFNGAGVLEGIELARYHRSHAEARRRAGAVPGSLGRWIQWLVAAPDERPTSPLSEIDREQYLAQLRRDHDVDSARAAFLIAPEDPGQMGRLGYLLAASGGGDHREIYGRFLLDRAIDAAPERLDLRRLRATLSIRGGIRDLVPRRSR